MILDPESSIAVKDNEYDCSTHERYWCPRCGMPTDVAAGDKPYFCSYCGVEFFTWTTRRDDD